MTGNTIKLTGSAELDQPLEHGKTYILSIEVEASDGGLVDHFNGDEDRVWRCKLVKAVFKNESGEIVRLKGQSKRHIAFYRAVAHYAKEQGQDIEQSYDALMGYLNSHVSEVWDMWKNN